MIYLDDNALIQRAIDGSNAFHASVKDSTVKAVYLDGERVHDALFADLENNFVVTIKKDINGKLIIVYDRPVHDIKFGKVTVEYR